MKWTFASILTTINEFTVEDVSFLLHPKTNYVYEFDKEKTRILNEKRGKLNVFFRIIYRTLIIQ